MELYEYTIQGLHDKLVKKEVSAVEITKSVLKRIDAVEGKVNAYITRTDELALAQAEAVDQRIRGGENPAPLTGIAGAINDSICTKGIKTTCASKTLSNFIPPYDATVMGKLSNHGLVMTGKTNLDEFAMGNSTETSFYAVTANPWDLTRTPGGSSGGSAAAVAAGEAVWALGSDTCGSVRQSAALCGLVGLKPTYGLVSRHGLVSYAPSLDQIGPITRDVTDCALMMNAIAGYDAKDSNSVNAPVLNYTKSLKQDLKGFKIGVPAEYFGEGIDEEIKKAVLQAIEDMKSLGASCVKVSMPHTGYALSVYYLIACAEASSNMARYDGVGFGWRSRVLDSGDNIASLYTKSRSESFGEEVKRRIILGTYALSAGNYDNYYLKALKVRTLIKEDFDRVFENVDMLITPTTPVPAPKIGEKTDDPLAMCLQNIYTAPANLAGVPAIAVPCGLTGGNLPIGLQIIGKSFGEEIILRAAYTFEQNHDYHKRITPLALGGGAL